MATIEYKIPSNINTFKYTEFDLVICTLPKKLTPVNKFLELKRKEQLERSKIIEAKKQEIDKSDELEEYEKYAAKRWIEKFPDFKLKTYIKFVQRIQIRYKELLEKAWYNVKISRCDATGFYANHHTRMSRKDISVFWNPKKDGSHVITTGHIWDHEKIQWVVFDNDTGELKARNNKIEKIREKFRSSHKMGEGSYENLGYYGYKSKYHEELFFEIIQGLKLDRKPEPPKTEIYDFECGFHHAVTSHIKLTAKRFMGATSKEEREKLMGELGGSVSAFDRSLINVEASK